MRWLHGKESCILWYILLGMCTGTHLSTIMARVVSQIEAEYKFVSHWSGQSTVLCHLSRRLKTALQTLLRQDY